MNDTIHKFWDTYPGHPDWSGFIPPHQFPGKTAWTFLLYKIGPDWAINCWTMSKLDELITFGSEKCLDWHYLQLAHEFPSWTSEMIGTFSLEKIDGQEPTTTLTYDKPWEDNPCASWYSDSSAPDDLKWWLCPFWLDLWIGKTAPQQCHLYLSIKS